MKKIITTALLILILTISRISFADVGSFDRYDSGSSSWSSSSSDWGSSSSSWDSDYSSSSSLDSFFLITLLLGNPARKSNMYNCNYFIYNICKKI